MFLKKRNKTKQNDEEKRQSILPRELNFRPLACKGNAIHIHHDTYRYTLALNLSHVTFLPMKFCRWTLFEASRALFMKN